MDMTKETIKTEGCTHYLELETIRAPPLISTIHKSPQRPLYLFQPVSSLAVPRWRLLTVEILQLSHSSPVWMEAPLQFSSNCPFSSPNSVQNWLGCPVIFLITPRHGPRRKHCSMSHPNLFRGNVFASPSNGVRNPVSSEFAAPATGVVLWPLLNNVSTRYNMNNNIPRESQVVFLHCYFIC
jgi:hypothetical protein